MAIAATAFDKTVIMTPGQSRALEAGYRVIWKSNPKDTGTVVGKDWSAVIIKWDHGKTISYHHNDMGNVESKV